MLRLTGERTDRRPHTRLVDAAASNPRVTGTDTETRCRRTFKSMRALRSVLRLMPAAVASAITRVETTGPRCAR